MKKAILAVVLVLTVCAAFAAAAPKVHNGDGTTENYFVHYYYHTTYFYHTYWAPVYYRPVVVAPVVYPVYTYHYWYYKLAGR